MSVAFNGFRELLHGVVKCVAFLFVSFDGDDGFVVEILGVIERVIFVLLGVTVMAVFLGCIVVFVVEILGVIGRVVFVLLGVTVMVVFFGLYRCLRSCLSRHTITPS